MLSTIAPSSRKHRLKILWSEKTSPTRCQRAIPRARELAERDYAVRVVIKFYDLIETPYEGGIEKLFDQRGIGRWERLEKEFPGITLKRVFNSLTPDKIRTLIDRATQI